MSTLELFWGFIMTSIKGYHLNTIPRGVYGQFSKIEEEFLELKDAIDQGSSILLLNEMADLIGAIEGFINEHFPGIPLEEVLKMTSITKRAFESGERTARSDT